jgi:hypothetical protein
LFGDGDNGWLQELRRLHYPPERNQVPAHLTLFHHLPPGIEAELGRRLAAYAAVAPPRAELAGVIDLRAGTAFRVRSEELEDMRHDLADAFRGLLVPQDRAPWRPHITIQNKVEPREAKRLQQQLRATFEPRPLAIRGLASWRYCGGPWEPIRSHIFRG